MVSSATINCDATETSLTTDVVRAATVQSPCSQNVVTADEFSKADVAQLSVVEIVGMTRNQLKQVIRSVQNSFRSRNVDDRLDFLDRVTLERLAYLARRCCRNQGY